MSCAKENRKSDYEFLASKIILLDKNLSMPAVQDQLGGKAQMDPNKANPVSSGDPSQK